MTVSSRFLTRENNYNPKYVDYVCILLLHHFHDGFKKH